MTTSCPYSNEKNAGDSPSDQPQQCPARGCKSTSSADTLVSIANARPLSYIDPSSVAQNSGSPEPSTSTEPVVDSALPTQRQVSSIPRSLENGKEEYWVYPSQHQFYQAMEKKQYEPKENDMSVIVPVHNAINEMAWLKIMEWERKYSEYETMRL